MCHYYLASIIEKEIEINLEGINYPTFFSSGRITWFKDDDNDDCFFEDEALDLMNYIIRQLPQLVRNEMIKCDNEEFTDEDFFDVLNSQQTNISTFNFILSEQPFYSLDDLAFEVRGRIIF